MSRLAAARLRSSSGYRLVATATLTRPEREALGNTLADPDCHALLCPLPGTPDRGVKAVSLDVALLFERLGTPATLPDALQATPSAHDEDVVRELIADGILEIEVQGEFTSGPAALPAITDGTRRSSPPGRLARLSIDALRYGERLAIADSRRLSARLYSFGRVPVTSRRERQFASWRSAVVNLGPDSRSRVAGPHRGGWTLASREPVDGWFSWRGTPRPGPAASAAGVPKLYISPATDAVAETFSTVSRILRDSAAMQVKIGADVAGVCRPDKIVVHFRAARDRADVAAELTRALHGCPAHGVPFTAELAGDGLLSTGIDPPPDLHAPRWLALQSWRLWVTNRLAVALIAARGADTGMAPSEFALARLRLEGVDTESWTPADLRFAA